MFGWLRWLLPWRPEVARRRILSGTARSGIRVNGSLELARSESLVRLPAQLIATTINVTDCRNLKSLPSGLRCWELILRRTELRWLPPDLQVTHRIDAEGCRRLRAIPALEVERLHLGGCTALEQLPEGLRVRWLDISGCARLTEIPASAAPTIEHLTARDCTNLAVLPEGLSNLRTLDLRGCRKIETLPSEIRVRQWIDVAGTSLFGLPWSLKSTKVQWRGVPVPDWVAFEPESITVEGILKEPNLEMRRVLLERFGIERFMLSAHTEVVDSDQDAGGPRQLLRVQFDGGEALLCVAVQCPSTGNRYVLRVPPQIRTCRQAVAWTAGFTNPDDYQPMVET
jgi:hypothetical protein